VKEFSEAQKEIRDITQPAELVGNNSEVLEEAFNKNMEALREEGFYYQDEEGLKLELISEEVPPYNKDSEEFHSFKEYLSLLEGRHRGCMELKAEDIRGFRRAFRQPLELDLNLPKELLADVYQDLDQEFDMDKVSVNYNGFGSTYEQAFEDSRLAFSMFGTDKTGYKEDIFVELEGLTPYVYARRVDSDKKENLREIYELLEDNPVYYRDVFMQDNPDEWLLAQKGAIELESTR